MPAAKKAAAKKAAAGTRSAATKAPARKATPAKGAPNRADATATKDATPVKKDASAPAAEPAFDQEFLDAQRQLLIEERATYLRQAETLQAEADSLAEQREPGDVQFDEESGEGDTLAVERERDLALSARARQEIEEIDRALEKIDAGTYGICEVSGDPIPRARLEAIPQARERVEYKVGGFGRR
jgi:RNA polymerase-binding transcription factor DksA